MDLNFFERLANTLKDNKNIQNFIGEIGNFLMNAMQENNMDILEQIDNQEKVSLISKNKMRNQKQEILQSYAREEQEMLYLVTKKRNEDNVYRVEQYDGSSMQVIDLVLSEDISSNDVIRQQKRRICCR